MHYSHLKRRLKQKLLPRCSAISRARRPTRPSSPGSAASLNRKRGDKVMEERKRLRPLPSGRFPDTLGELTVPVSTFSTVRIKKCAYSVPARLIGADVRAYVSEKAVVIHHLGQEVARHARVAGKRHQVNYRHVIKSLVRKPGAFARCQYPEDLFPQLAFRHADERLQANTTMNARRSATTS